MTSTYRWTSADLDALPDDGKRYEIIDGELFVSKQPHFYHQMICTGISTLLFNWSKQGKLGQAVIAPGVIFAEDNDVVPDVVWISNERLPAALGKDGKFHSAPDLVIEVLSPGRANERRDREAKLKLYSRLGVMEYWIVDWLAHCVEIYRRQGSELELFVTLTEGNLLQSSLLPNFSAQIDALFTDLP